MRKNNISYIASVVIVIANIFYTLNLSAQDMHLSQFWRAETALNPGAVGMSGDSYRFHLHQRTQWAKLASKPFLTEVFSFDMPYDRFGIGATIVNNTMGAGNLNEFHFLPAISFQITENNDIHHLCAGVQPGFIYKSINISNLLFDSQYNDVTGEYDANLPNEENFIKNREMLFDLGFGAYYYTRHPLDAFKGKTAFSGIIPVYGGFSAFHLTQPKEKYFGSGNVQHRRWVGYAGAMYKFHQDFGVEGNVLYMRQAKNNDLSMGLLVHYHLKQGTDHYFINAGAHYRWKDAVIPQIGFSWREFNVGLSYDINVSSLKTYSRGRGGFEIAITYLKEMNMIASFFRGAIF